MKYMQNYTTLLYATAGSPTTKAATMCKKHCQPTFYPLTPFNPVMSCILWAKNPLKIEHCSTLSPLLSIALATSLWIHYKVKVCSLTSVLSLLGKDVH